MILLSIWSSTAFAKTNSITIPCRGPIAAPEGGLRASSDGDAWEFSLVPGDHTELYDQHWFFNGIAPGTPNMATSWGQLLGGQDGSNSLMWLSPTQGGTYSIKVKAKRRCTLTGGGGGGGTFDPNFEISWGVEVAAKKTWDGLPVSSITWTDRAFKVLFKRLLRFVKPQSQLVVGNFSPENSTRDYMEFALWYLKHRDESALAALANSCGVAHENISIGKEPEGVNLFLHVERSEK